jgi:hypothetical protein
MVVYSNLTASINTNQHHPHITISDGAIISNDAEAAAHHTKPSDNEATSSIPHAAAQFGIIISVHDFL